MHNIKRSKIKIRPQDVLDILSLLKKVNFIIWNYDNQLSFDNQIEYGNHYLEF